MCNALELEDSAEIIEIIETLGTLKDQMKLGDQNADDEILRTRRRLLTIRLMEVGAKYRK